MRAKEQFKRLLGRNGVDRVRRFLGRKSHFDEVQLVNVFLRRKGIRGTMVDVGAHHGSSLSQFAEDGWRVIAFEPDDANRRVLVDAFGSHPSVTIDARAVSDRSETGKPFYSSEVSTGISGLLSFHESHVQSKTVDVTTISEIIDQFSIDHIEFLKIDTEGYDLFVLRGLNTSRDRPDVIVCEFENRKTIQLGYTTDEMVAWLEAAGYTVTLSEWYPIERYGGQHRWRAFRETTETLAEDSWGNLIAYRRDRPFEGLRYDRIGRLAGELFAM